MTIRATYEPDLFQKYAIFDLWNKEYPKQLAYSDIHELEDYLGKLRHGHHLFALEEDKIAGWAFAFERDARIWFAIIVDAAFQGRKVGTSLLGELKKYFSELNGWVTDHSRYIKANGEPYASPLSFYLKNDFCVLPDVRLETEHLSAVKIQWTANK